MNTALQGLHILVTRPLKQATQTRDTLQAAGATVSLFPLLEIAPAAEMATARQQLAKIRHYDCLIFVSINAVEHAFDLGGDAFRNGLQHCRIGAIGKRTAQALESEQLTVDFQPESGFTSEDFLALSGLQAVNKHSFLIVRGEGGRGVLAKILRQRGADVSYVDVYRRVCPADSTAEKLIKHYTKQQIDIIALTSGESLHNLLTLMNNIKWLKQTPLLVGSQRIGEQARRAGFTAAIIVAADPGDQAMQAALIRWRQDKTT